MQRIVYQSTRACRKPAGKDSLAGRTGSGIVTIESAIAQGMPGDGGLYVPSGLPRLPERVFDPAFLSYAELATLVLQPFFPGWENGRLGKIIESAYGRAPDGAAKMSPDRGTGESPDRGAACAPAACFDTGEICPLVPLHGLSSELDGGPEIYLLELFHGRTGAFKDIALSVLGGLLKESLERLGEKRTSLVLAATSGDTGSATLTGFAGVPGILTAVLYPADGTSDIQRLQMITQQSSSSFVAGVRGNFDDAQRLVKRLFGDDARLTAAGFAADSAGPGAAPGQRSAAPGRASIVPAGLFPGVVLSSANSINIGRLLPQIVYYVKAWRDLAARHALGPGQIMNVAVPSGNFGDILAAKYAKDMGLPIGRLLCASNANKVLADFFATGVYDRRRELVATASPSMDILVSSNLERLLFMASGGDPERTARLMDDLARRGWFEIDDAEKRYLSDFCGGWCGDESAKSSIAKVWSTDRVLIDPHTATAVEVLQRSVNTFSNSGPVVVAATASPFKFPESCLEALGAEASARGSLVSARRLSSLTAISPPAFILGLEQKQVVGDRVVALDEVESALAGFVSTAVGEVSACHGV